MNNIDSFVVELKELLDNNEPIRGLELILDSRRLLNDKYASYLANFQNIWRIHKNNLNSGTNDDIGSLKKDLKNQIRRFLNVLMTKDLVITTQSSLVLDKPNLTNKMFAHCLRPTFTMRVIEKMFKGFGTSMNIYGDDDLGKERLCEDILDCFKLINFEGFKLIKLHLSEYIYSYEDLLKEVQSQIGHKSKLPSRVDAFFDTLLEGQWYFIFLFNYDAILGNTEIDTAYDKNFFQSIRKIKDMKNIVLIVFTKKPHNGSSAFIEKKIYNTSFLNFEMIELNALTFSDIKREFFVLLEKAQRLSWLDGKEYEQSLLLNKCLQHRESYALLMYFAEKITANEDEGIPFTDRVIMWEKKFKKENALDNYVKINRVKQTVEKFLIASGVNKIKLPVISLINKLFKQDNGKKK